MSLRAKQSSLTLFVAANRYFILSQKVFRQISRCNHYLHTRQTHTLPSSFSFLSTIHYPLSTSKRGDFEFFDAGQLSFKNDLSTQTGKKLRNVGHVRLPGLIIYGFNKNQAAV